MASFKKIDLKSEIINQKKQLIFEVSQSTDATLPNNEYIYDVYVKNVSGVDVENVHIDIIAPSDIIFEEVNSSEVFERIQRIGDMKNGDVKYLQIAARVTTIGSFTVHFCCYGKNTGMFNVSKTIESGFDKTQKETIHRIGLYKFDEYEQHYTQKTHYYNKNVTQLTKYQKKPFDKGLQPFPMIIDGDETEEIIRQINRQKNVDELPTRYLGRELGIVDKVESFTGKNLRELINEINEKSDYINIDLLRVGSNELDNDLFRLYPDGFINRFGLLRSEIFHHTGVIPTFENMGKYLFRWAPTQEQIERFFPKINSFEWSSKYWAGDGCWVYEYYDNDEEEIHTKNQLAYFETRELAEEFIRKNEMYNSNEGLEGYSYVIKDVYLDSGVFYMDLPLEDIPSNFFILDNDEIEVLMNKTKPYGMKGLIRYIVSEEFTHYPTFRFNQVFKPYTQLKAGEILKILYDIRSYQYGIDNDGNLIFENSGYNANNKEDFSHNPSLDVVDIKPLLEYSHRNNLAFMIDNVLSNIVYETEVINDLSLSSTIKSIIYSDNFNSFSYEKSIPDSEEFNYPELSQPSEPTYEIEPISTYWENIVQDKPWIVKKDVVKNSNTNYTIVDDGMNIDAVRTTLIFKEDDIETGLALQTENYDFVISATYNSYYGKHYISVTKNTRSNIVECKDGYATVEGLSIDVEPINESKDLVTVYIQYNGKLQYIHHEIIDSNNQIKYFIRNKRITDYYSNIKNQNDVNFVIQSNLLASNVLRCSYNANRKATINTPIHEECNENVKYEILTNDNSWINLHRIDENTSSYTLISNIDKELIEVPDLNLYVSELDIPDNAVIENIDIELSAETNIRKEAKVSHQRNKNSTINLNDIERKVVYTPELIENHKIDGFSTIDLINKLNIAYNTNNPSDEISKQINETIQFNERTKPNLDYIYDDNTVYKIRKPYWTTLSDFSYQAYPFTEVEYVEFIIKGYNHGSNVKMFSQLSSELVYADINTTEIETGFFYKKIQLPFKTVFRTDTLNLNYRFSQLNDLIEIYDTRIVVTFSKKQNEVDNIYLNPYNFDIYKKQIYNIPILKDKSRAIDYKYGLLINMQFEDLLMGEYIKIFAINLNVTYRNTESDVISYHQDTKGLAITGDEVDNPLIQGLIFNEIPTVVQEQVSQTNLDGSYNKGFELKDTLYQSFTAEKDNITSIELFTNGFVGVPDENLTIAIHRNNKTIPGAIIKEIHGVGWVDKNLTKNSNMVKYDIYVDNLTPGEKYWFSIKLSSPSDNDYYLIKHYNTPLMDYELLKEEHDNLMNEKACLAFNINSTNLKDNFKHLPYVNEDIENPFLMLRLNKGVGKIENLRIKKLKNIL